MNRTSWGLDAPRVPPIDPLVDEIRRRRVEADWSLGELSRRSGVSLRHVWAVDHGKRGVSLHTLRLLAAAFDLEPALRPRTRP